MERFVRQRYVGETFYPTDYEIVGYYLLQKINGHDENVSAAITEITLCDYEPERLPALSRIPSGTEPWFFIYERQRSTNGTMRMTSSGFWKVTGVGREIKLGGRLIGTKRTLVFYRGRSRSAVKTGWVMHEYSSCCESDYAIGKLKNNGELIEVDSEAQDIDISGIDVNSLGWREIYELCRPRSVYSPNQLGTAANLDPSDIDFINSLSFVDRSRAAELFSDQYEIPFERQAHIRRQDVMRPKYSTGLYMESDSDTDCESSTEKETEEIHQTPVESVKEGSDNTDNGFDGPLTFDGEGWLATIFNRARRWL